MRRAPAFLHVPADAEARLLTLATLVTTLGTGAYLTAVTLYLTRSVGMAPSAVGLGLTLGGIFGLVAGVVLGDQADRRGAREVIVAGLAIDALATCALIGVHGIATLAAAAGGVAIGRAGSSSARGALIALIAGSEGASRLRAYLRAVTNVGLSVGTLGAAVVLALDSRGAYVGMLLADAATSLVAAVVVLRLPRRPATRTAPAAGERRWLALGDPAYLAFTLAASVASLQYFVMTVSLPLWVTLRTSAPRWSVAVLLFVACLVVAALQVPATRNLRGPRSAGRMVAHAGPLFALAWLLIVLAGQPPAWAAVALLLAAVVLHSMAEVRQVAGTFELSFALARPGAHGQYQGVFGLAIGIAEVVAPALLVLLCITWGWAGWLVLAAIVTGAGWACAGIERWAAVRRPAAMAAVAEAPAPQRPASRTAAGAVSRTCGGPFGAATMRGPGTAATVAAMTPRRSILVLAGALSALAAPAAQAAEIGYDGDDLIFAAAPGEINKVSVYESHTRGVGYVWIADVASATSYPADRCQPVEGGRLDCEARGAIYVALGDGDDDFGMGIGERLVNPVAVLGGPGSDRLTGNRYNPTVAVLAGEDGDDTLQGGLGDEELHGGPGNDRLDGAAGADKLFGEEGDDTLDGDHYEAPSPDLIDGGPGVDTVEGWTRPDQDHQSPIAITLDDQPGDGRAGEGDDVRAIERITSHVSGTFELSDADDVVDVWANQDDGASKVLARGGADRVKGGNNAETIDGGAGDDQLVGGFGNDTLTGGPGRDQLFGDRVDEQCGLFESCVVPFGNDVIDARDGEADQVDCGPGVDRAVVDSLDTVANCEEVVTGGAPAAPPAGPGAPPTGPAGEPAPTPRAGAAGRVAVRATARRRGGRVVVAGRLVPRPGTPRGACAGARVSATVVAGKRRVGRAGARVGRSCRFSVRVPGRRGRLTVVVAVRRSAALAAATTRVAVRGR